MTVTTETITGPATTPDPVPVDVRVLDADAVLAEVVAHRAAAQASEARVLMLAVHYVDLHPVTEQHPAASPATRDRTLAVHGSEWERDETPLAGEGTPGVAEHAVEELGAVLGVPFGTAYALCADSVAVCYRLPRLWARVHAGRLAAWQARMVARQTTGLSAEVAGWVDRQVTVLVDRRRYPSLRVLRDLVHEARLRMDPDHEAAVEERALAGRGVWFDHQTSTASAATTTMSAVLDAWDGLDLDAALSDVAAQLRAVGDSRDVDQRRADALALLADPQRVLDLDASAAAAASDPAAGADSETTGRPSCTERPERTPGSVISLYVHANLADLAQAGLAQAGLAQSGPAQSGSAQPCRSGTSVSGPVSADGFALVERLGPLLLDVVAGWLGRTDRIVIRPVLHLPDLTEPGPDPGAGFDTAGTRPVDRHDPPPAMRDLVILRDGQCVFPGCRVDARGCDVDHIDAYVDPDDGGPPGQTRPGNLACLCRRHHRLKTFTAWHYQHADDGSYVWTSPRGQTFTTHPSPKRASVT